MRLTWGKSSSKEDEDYRQFRPIGVGECHVQTAKDRFGTEGERAVLDREQASLPAWPTITDNDEDEGEDGVEQSIYRVVPTMQPFRNNLTALSNSYNLYFVAYQGRIFVYRPRSCINHNLPRHPDLQLIPPQSECAIEFGGYIDREHGHLINHIITGYLGDEEIVLVSYDDGDVVAYYTRPVTHYISNKLRNETIYASSSKTRASANEKPSRNSLRPFFHDNVGRSAWGLAVHKQSRLIAVSSNKHEVTVFAFGVHHGTADSTDTGQSPTNDHSHQEADVERWVRKRQCNWRIVIALGPQASNIPNICFLDSEDGHAQRICAIDLRGMVWVANIWKPNQAAEEIPIFHRNFYTSEEFPPYTANGWGVLALRHNSFLKVNSIWELLGHRSKDDITYHETTGYLHYHVGGRPDHPLRQPLLNIGYLFRHIPQNPCTPPSVSLLASQITFGRLPSDDSDELEEGDSEEDNEVEESYEVVDEIDESRDSHDGDDGSMMQQGGGRLIRPFYDNDSDDYAPFSLQQSRYSTGITHQTMNNTHRSGSGTQLYSRHHNEPVVGEEERVETTGGQHMNHEASALQPGFNMGALFPFLHDTASTLTHKPPIPGLDMDTNPDGSRSWNLDLSSDVSTPSQDSQAASPSQLEEPTRLDMVYRPHLGKVFKAPSTVDEKVSMLREQSSNLNQPVDANNFQDLAPGYHILRTFEKDFDMWHLPLEGDCISDNIGMLGSEALGFGLFRHPQLGPWFQGTGRINMLHYVPELSLVVLGSPTGRVMLATLTRLASPVNDESGGVWEYGMRVEWVLPKIREEDQHRRKWARPLYGVALGRIWDGVWGVDDSCNNSTSNTGGEAMRGGGAAGKAKGVDASIPRRYRLMLHYMNHSILTYEISRDEETGKLCLL